MFPRSRNWLSAGTARLLRKLPLSTAGTAPWQTFLSQFKNSNAIAEFFSHMSQLLANKPVRLRAKLLNLVFQRLAKKRTNHHSYPQNVPVSAFSTDAATGLSLGPFPLHSGDIPILGASGKGQIMDNQGSVVLRGRIGSDLSSMSAQNGTKGLRFRMAAPQWRITDAGQYEEREPKWYTVCVWDRLAQNIARSVQKGTPVIVCGRPSARGWLGPDQQVRSELVINASFMGIDLVFGPAVALKPQHPSNNVAESSTAPAEEFAVDAGESQQGSSESQHVLTQDADLTHDRWENSAQSADESDAA